MLVQIEQSSRTSMEILNNASMALWKQHCRQLKVEDEKVNEPQLVKEH